MIELPNKKKCYNLPEQVAQNLLNIQYLAEQYKNIDELPSIWADYKTAFDADLHTFEDWTTTFEGWENTLATYLANMSSAAVGAIAGQNIAPANVAASGTLTANHAQIFEQIEDSNGHLRFIENDNTQVILPTITGVTFTYGRWSLSGSHFMFVVAGNIAAGTALTAQINPFAQANLPSWIAAKIIPMYSTVLGSAKMDVVDHVTYTMHTVSCAVDKVGDYGVRISYPTYTQDVSNDGSFRIQIDLLIDNN